MRSSARVQQRATSGGPRVLVIDDDDFLRDIATRILTSAGYEVQAAGNGRQGLSLFDARPADIVITDILMPEVEGMATITALRRRPRPPKILAISGGGCRGRSDYLQWAEALGADAVLAKPFGMSALLGKMNELSGGDA